MINYFVQSKARLFLVAHMNSGRPMVEERLRLLAADEDASKDRPAPLERLIEIFLVPAV